MLALSGLLFSFLVEGVHQGGFDVGGTDGAGGATHVLAQHVAGCACHSGCGGCAEALVVELGFERVKKIIRARARARALSGWLADRRAVSCGGRNEGRCGWCRCAGRGLSVGCDDGGCSGLKGFAHHLANGLQKGVAFRDGAHDAQGVKHVI